MGIKRNRHEYTKEQRVEILLLHGQGKNPTTIAKALELSEHGVRYFLSRTKKTKSIADAPRSGRPIKVSEDIQHQLDMALRRGQVFDNGDIKRYLLEQHKIRIGHTAISDLMKKMKFRSYILRRKPLVSKRARKNRVRQCRKWKREGPEFWRCVVFTDETTIKLVSTGRKKRRYLPKGFPFGPSRMEPKAAFGGGSVSLWAALSRRGVLAWSFFEGELTAKSYLKIVKTKLLEQARAEFGEEDWILQQDGDPAHTAHATVEELEELGESRGFTLLPWPAYSPDLNVIENFWAELKDDISKQRRPLNLPGLRRLVAERIDHFNREENQVYFEKLYNSMPLRIAQVISSHGFPTDH